MKKPDLEVIVKEACRLARAAGTFIRQESLSFDRSRVEYKGVNDLVSYVDKTAERILVDGLIPLIDGAGFITEEQTVLENEAGYKWIIDPLDGTTNFVHGLPCYCVSIGLLAGKKLVMGVVYEINFDECFYATEGGPALLNGKRIQVSATSGLNRSLIATGFPYTNYTRMEPYMKVFDYCMHHTHGLRRLGSAAADLVYVACGRLDGFYEYGLKPWDVAGGAFIVQQAAGIVTDFSGSEGFLFGEELLACSPAVHADFLPVIQKFFNSKNA